MKIQSKPRIYKGIKLDSGLEESVLRCLEQYFPLPSILCHKGLLIRPESQWFPAQEWKVDFTVLQERKPFIYIEAKGYIQVEFKEKMKNLAYLKPEIFEKLIVVCPEINSIARGFVSYDLKTLDRYLSKNDINGLINDCKKRRSKDDV